MSVSPPPGGAWKLWIALGGGPGLIGRNEWPASTDPYQTLRCVPVPVGPLAKTRPSGATPTDGSPNVWIGSTTTGVSKPIGAADAGATTSALSARATATVLLTTSRHDTPHAGDPELECGGPCPRGDGAGRGARRAAGRRRRAAGDPGDRAGGGAARARGARLRPRRHERPARHRARPPARRADRGARAARGGTTAGAALARAPRRRGGRGRHRAARVPRADLEQARAGQGAHARGDVRASRVAVRAPARARRRSQHA